MTKIIDNSKETLSAILNTEFSNVKEVAIASAYFNLAGYKAVGDGLTNKPLKLLLGREPLESVKFEEEAIRKLEEFDDDFRAVEKEILGNEIMQNEDDGNYFSRLSDAVKYFNKPDVEIRRVKGRFFHGKAYMGASPSFHEVTSGFAAVGSSNFTGGGLAGNRELNMLTTDREGLKELVKWFFSLWDDTNSVDFKSKFLELLKNYVVTHTPYEVLAKALYEVYRPQLDEARTNNLMKTLFPHQVLSTIQASRILKTYNGVIIADSTGLGKTRVAINLAVMAINEGKNPLLIAPKSALDTTWNDEMDKTHVHIDSAGSEYFSQHPNEAIKNYREKDFIIVDEAHYFKSSCSNRYGALRDLMASGEKQIILLTATPINNSLMDLYSLLSLYLRDDSISDISPSLKGYFSMQQKSWRNDDPVDIDAILRRFVVRTSRELAKVLSEEKLKFPVRRLDEDPLARYETEIDYEMIDASFDRLNFIYYDYAIDKLGKELKLPDGTPISSAVMEDKKRFLKDLVKIVMRINFFKRLESSIYAFKTTMETLLNYVENSKEYAKNKGYYVPPRMRGDLMDLYLDDEEWKPPSPEEIFAGKDSELMEKCKLTDVEKNNYIEKCNSDISVIKEIIGNLPEHDVKLQNVLSRVQRIKLSGNNGVILFSQYFATAEYVYRQAKEMLKENVMLTTGAKCIDRSGNAKDKTSVIKDFMKNGGYLFSTDVLSESQNLQNAQYIVNYDFPWNPVVLIQRAGRIDRIGSQHDEIFLINVLPENGDENDPKSLAHFLTVMKKLYKRIGLISGTIGIDSTALGEEASPRDFEIQEAIARNEPKILDVLQEKIQQFTKDPIETLADIMNKRGEKWLSELPIGIGSYKLSERDGLFILFRNKDDFYWVLKFFDGNKEIIQNPNEIISRLLEGKTDNSGEIIEYRTLMNSFKEIKYWLKSRLEEELKVQAVQQGRKIKSSKQEQDISAALQSLGDKGIALSAKFNVERSKQTVVSTLYKALKEGTLLEKAIEVLDAPTSSQDDVENDVADFNVELRRVCWCLLKKES
jgi:hypothetical protein